MLNDTDAGRRSIPQAIFPRQTAAPLNPVSNRSSTEDDQSVGKRIKQLRRAMGATQVEMATRVGVTGAQFHRYETGQTRVAASRLVAIAKALGVDPSALLGQAPVSVTRPEASKSNSTGEEILELIEILSSISCSRERRALICFARFMTTQAAASEQPAADANL
jgi:transcriptional regulator with XRE-family HTH domain